MATSATRRSGASAGPASRNTVRGKSCAAGPPTPSATPASAIVAVPRPNASFAAAAPKAARRAARPSRAESTFAQTSLPTACGSPTRTRSARTSAEEKRGPVGNVRSRAGGGVLESAATARGSATSEEAEDHERELQEVGPDDGALSAERRVRDEERGRQDEDARGIPRGRGDDRRSAWPRSGARTRRFPRATTRTAAIFRTPRPYVAPMTSAIVVAPVALRRGARKRPSADEAERAREIQPEGRKSLRRDERGEDERRRAADRRSRRARAHPERAEPAVRDEERVRRARGRTGREEADEEDGGAVEREGRDHAGIRPRGRRARSRRGDARRDEQRRSSKSKSGAWCGPRAPPARPAPTNAKAPGTRRRNSQKSSPPIVRHSDERAEAGEATPRRAARAPPPPGGSRARACASGTSSARRSRAAARARAATISGTSAARCSRTSAVERAARARERHASRAAC